MLLKKISILLILLLPTIVFAQQVQVDVRHRPPEIVFTQNKPTGPVISIIDKLLVAIKAQPLWLNVPWPRTLMRAKNGQVDIIPRHSMTPEREKYLLPLLIGYEKRTLYYLFAPQIKNIEQYQSIKQLNKLYFGMLRGSYYGGSVENITSKTVVYANNIDQLMGMLLAGRIDVMPIQNLVWAQRSYAKIKHEYDNVQYKLAEINKPFFSGKYISIPKRSQLKNHYHQLNCLLYQWRKSGKIDQIYVQYKITPYTQLFDTSESKKQARSCEKGL